MGAEAVVLNGDVLQHEALGQALNVVLDGHEPAHDGGGGVGEEVRSTYVDRAWFDNELAGLNLNCSGGRDCSSKTCFPVTML